LVYFIFIVVLTANHDTQQNANSEDNCRRLNIQYKVYEKVRKFSGSSGCYVSRTPPSTRLRIIVTASAPSLTVILERVSFEQTSLKNCNSNEESLK
jgi:hypothetical protein